MLGIKNPRTDSRIDFVGGIRGIDELERRANSDMQLAFFNVSDINYGTFSCC